MDSKVDLRKKFILYPILYFIIALITSYIVANTHTYDPAWMQLISFLLIGIPFTIAGIVITLILYKLKVRWHIEIISAIVIIIVMVSAFSTLIHKSKLPGEGWEYSEELSELYSLSVAFGDYNQLRVYLGEENTQGREAAIYMFNHGWNEWEYIDNGIEIDGKLFIDNWRVYPTEYVGISHIGRNPYGAGQAIYIDHLTIAEDTYTIYLKNDTGNFISNLSFYSAVVGDVLAVFGEWEDAPIEGCRECDHLIVDKIEVVEILS